MSRFWPESVIYTTNNYFKLVFIGIRWFGDLVTLILLSALIAIIPHVCWQKFHSSMKVCSEKPTLTWFGMSRLLLGNRTQFLHILLTRSSLITTISWLQYWILKGKTWQASFSFLNQKNFQNVTSCHRYLWKSTSCTLKSNIWAQETIFWHYVLPAWVGSEHRKWHPLSELLCDVICQGRPEENMFIYICPYRWTLWC